MSRSRSRGREGEQEAVNTAAKKEFVDNLQQLLYFYNNILKISPQFNPVMPYLTGSSAQMPAGHNLSQSVSASNTNIRFENIQLPSQSNEEANAND